MMRKTLIFAPKFEFMRAPQIIVGLMILLFSQASFSQTDSRGYIVSVGDKAPAFSMELTNGNKINSNDFKGKVVMLQFTASWCGVCRKEMPFIEDEIWQKLKDNKEFALYGIDRDEPLEKVIDFGKKTGISYPLGLDPGAEIFQLFAEKEAGITRNVILDRNGNIIYMTRLFNREEFSEMKKVIFEELEK